MNLGAHTYAHECRLPVRFYCSIRFNYAVLMQEETVVDVYCNFQTADMQMYKSSIPKCSARTHAPQSGRVNKYTLVLKQVAVRAEIPAIDTARTQSELKLRSDANMTMTTRRKRGKQDYVKKQHTTRSIPMLTKTFSRERALSRSVH